MTHHVDRPLRRPISILAATAMALTMLVAAPSTARAHDACTTAQPTATGLVSTVLAYANVFASFLSTAEISCTSKYEIEPKMDRDWVAEAGVADPLESRADRGKSRTRGNAPKTFAPCVEGMAADFFPCDDVDLMSHVSMTELGLGQGDVPAYVNDIWGWTDTSAKGKAKNDDYALLGSSEGTVFVNVTDPKRPAVLGILPTASDVGGNVWRDIKVYDDHAFVVSEHDNHGVQVFDLTRLRDWDGTYTVYDADARYTGHGSAHNIGINTETGFAYSVGAGPFSSLGLPFTVSVEGGDSYLANGAAFGTPLDQVGVTSDFADVGGTACDPVTDDLSGSIAIVDRGGCAFTQKANNVQAAGALALIVVNNQPGGANFLGGSDANVLIGVVSLSQTDGAALRDSLPATGSVVANDPPALCGDGLHVIDVSDPKNPVFAGCERETGYVHDVQCIVYDGPDTEFTGREICFNSNGLEYRVNGQNFLSIVDVTDKANPVVLSRVPYGGSGYSHQGWLTEDRRYFMHGDEGDEFLTGVNATTRTWDVSDLRAPAVVDVYEGTTSIDHNIYTEGDVAYASNYTSGLRVFDVADVGTDGPEEIAFFDVYPENDDATFEGGTWSNYPFFRQKNVVAVSSIDRGLFILRPRGDAGR